MREHSWHGPEDHEEPNEYDNCQACVLSYCKVCRGGEAELPEECPGRVMTPEEQVMVGMDELDYMLGCWWLRGKIVWDDKTGRKVPYQ